MVARRGPPLVDGALVGVGRIPLLPGDDLAHAGPAHAQLAEARGDVRKVVRQNVGFGHLVAAFDGDLVDRRGEADRAEADRRALDVGQRHELAAADGERGTGDRAEQQRGRGDGHGEGGSAIDEDRNDARHG